MTVTQFGFTKLVVRDIDASEEFYRSVFGMKAVHRVRSEEHSYKLEEVIMALPGADGHRLALVRYLERPCPPSGSAWTGFVVADLENALAAIARSGGTIEVPAHENAEHGVVAAIAKDPDGHPMEIIELIGRQRPTGGESRN